MAWPVDWVNGDLLNATNLNTRLGDMRDYIDAAVPGTLQEESFTGSTSSSITLGATPLTTMAFMLFKNGTLLTVGTDFTRTTTAITLSHARTTDDVFRAIYYS